MFNLVNIQVKLLITTSTSITSSTTSTSTTSTTSNSSCNIILDIISHQIN